MFHSRIDLDDLVRRPSSLTTTSICFDDLERLFDFVLASSGLADRETLYETDRSLTFRFERLLDRPREASSIERRDRFLLSERFLDESISVCFGSSFSFYFDSSLSSPRCFDSASSSDLASLARDSFDVDDLASSSKSLSPSVSTKLALPSLVIDDRFDRLE